MIIYIRVTRQCQHIQMCCQCCAVCCIVFGKYSHLTHDLTEVCKTWYINVNISMSTSSIVLQCVGSVLQCAARWCKVVQCVGSVLQCTAVWCSVFDTWHINVNIFRCVAVCCSFVCVQCVCRTLAHPTYMPAEPCGTWLIELVIFTWMIGFVTRRWHIDLFAVYSHHHRVRARVTGRNEFVNFTRLVELVIFTWLLGFVTCRWHIDLFVVYSHHHRVRARVTSKCAQDTPFLWRKEFVNFTRLVEFELESLYMHMTHGSCSVR